MLTVVLWQTAFGAMFFVPVAYVEDGSGLVALQALGRLTSGSRKGIQNLPNP
jgi:hypothetical protein